MPIILHSRFGLLLTILLLVWSVGQYAVAQESESIREEQDFSFAMGLYRDSLFQMASEQFAQFETKHEKSRRRDEAAFLKGECLAAIGQHASALDSFTEFLLRYSQSRFAPDARFRKGQSLLQLGRASEAVREFRIILDRHNDRDIAGEAAYWIGESYFKNGDDENAIKYYLLAAEGYPQSPVRDYALYSIGWTYQKKGDLARAAQAYERMAREYPASKLAPEAIVRAGECLYQRKDYVKAESWLMDAASNVTLADHKARRDYVLADSKYQRGQHAEAIASFRQFLRDHPAHPLRRDAQYALGWSYLKTKQYPASIESFRALAADSDDLGQAALFRLGVAFGLDGKNDSARARYDETVRRFPNGEYADNALYEAAALSFEGKQWKNARTLLERLLKDYPKSELRPEAQRMVGECLLAEGDIAGAEKQFAAAASAGEASDEVRSLSLFQSAWSQYKLKNHDQAAALFAQFLQRYPAHERRHLAFFWKGESEYASGKFADARSSYVSAAATKDGEKREDALYGAAWSSLRLSRFDDAIAGFEQLLVEYPKGSRAFDARLRLGDCYFQKKDYRKAAESYLLVIRLFPGHSGLDEAHYQLGQSFEKAGNNAEAYKAFEALVTQIPASPLADDAQYALGWISFKRKEFNDAITEFQKVVKNYPDGDAAPRAWYSMGDAYYNQQMYEPAEKTYRELLKRHPEHPLVADATVGIQYCLIARGKDQEAMAVIDEFVREHPTSPAAADLQMKKADLLFNKKNYPGAATEYRAFLSKFPRSRNAAQASYRLAESYRLQGNLTEAAETYERTATLTGVTPTLAGRSVLDAARIYIDQGASQKALGVLDGVIKKNAVKAVVAEARLLRGILFERAGNRGEAAAEYQALVTDLPTLDVTDDARVRLARIHLAGSRPEEARTLAERVATSRKDALGAEAQCLVAETYAAQSNWAEALKAYLRVRYVFPSHAKWITRSAVGAGIAYERLGDPGKAADQYRSAVKTAGDAAAVKEAQDRLLGMQKP